MLSSLGLRAIVMGPPSLERWGVDAIEAAGAPIFAPGTAGATLVLLGTFITKWPGLWIMLHLVHRRHLNTLFGPEGRLNWSHLRFGLGVSLAVGAIAWGPTIFGEGVSAFTVRDVGDWLVLLALGLPLLFVQVATEEMVFRGYWLQQLASRFWSPVAWSVLPSLVFAYAHNTDTPILGVSWFHFVFGMIMAAVTSRTGNLGAAIGMHLGHNVINILVVSSASKSTGGIAMFTLRPGIDTELSNQIYVALIFLCITVFMFVRDWTFIRQWRAARAARMSRELGQRSP